MTNFRSSVKRCDLFGSKIVIHWFLLTSNLLLINCSSDVTDFSYDFASHTSPVQYSPTTESYGPNSIETQIKQFLNVHPSNKSLDNVIRSVFNIDNPNPMYIFVLPGEQNRTLVLTRNNFDKAVYPNISTGQRFVKDDRHSNKLLQLFDSNTHKDKLKKSDVADNTIFDLKDLDESESMRIVAENVRTERNFIEFMERLNENANLGGGDVIPKKVALNNPKTKQVNREYEDLVSPKLKYKFEIDYSADLLKPTTQNSLKTTELDWKDLGLDGWMGGLREPGKDFDKIITE